MSAGLHCPTCKATAWCIETRGWHGHRCSGCGAVQVFTQGRGSIPADLDDQEATT